MVFLRDDAACRIEVMLEGDAILITGMHRSGTSLVANLCQELGVWLGTERQLLAPTANDPRGYFEHAAVVEINVQLLRVLDRSSDNPRLPFPAAWQMAPAVQDLKAKAMAILERDLAVRPLWGFKDPRLCLTLPFWLSLVPRARLVFVFRHPMEVAYSLVKRGFTLEWGLYLWAAYHWASLSSLSDVGTVHMVSYRSLLTDAHKSVGALARFFGNSSMGLKERAQKVVSHSLYRNRKKELLQQQRVAFWPFSLAFWLLEWSAKNRRIVLVPLLKWVLGKRALYPPKEGPLA